MKKGLLRCWQGRPFRKYGLPIGQSDTVKKDKDGGCYETGKMVG